MALRLHCNPKIFGRILLLATVLPACNPSQPLALPASNSVQQRPNSDSIMNTSGNPDNPPAVQPAASGPAAETNGAKDSKGAGGNTAMNGDSTNSPANGTVSTQSNNGGSGPEKTSPSGQTGQTSGTVVNPTGEMKPGELRVTDVSFPSSIKSDETVQVSFSITNTGAPVQGVYSTVRIRAKTNFGDLERSSDIESTDTIPSGQSTKTLTFKVPPISLKLKANACIKAFSDKARKQSISMEICKDVDVN